MRLWSSAAGRRSLLFGTCDYFEVISSFQGPHLNPSAKSLFLGAGIVPRPGELGGDTVDPLWCCTCNLGSWMGPPGTHCGAARVYFQFRGLSFTIHLSKISTFKQIFCISTCKVSFSSWSVFRCITGKVSSFAIFKIVRIVISLTVLLRDLGL